MGGDVLNPEEFIEYKKARIGEITRAIKDSADRFVPIEGELRGIQRRLKRLKESYSS